MQIMQPNLRGGPTGTLHYTPIVEFKRKAPKVREADPVTSHDAQEGGSMIHERVLAKRRF